MFVDNDRDREGEPEKIISEVKNITKASLNVEQVYPFQPMIIYEIIKSDYSCILNVSHL